MNRRREKPLVLVINNVHLFENNVEAKKLLLQLQQRAESWAASGILTLVLARWVQLLFGLVYYPLTIHTSR